MNHHSHSHQVFVSPKLGLANNAEYDVVIQGTHSGMVSAANPNGSFSRSFRFGTASWTTELN